MKGHQLNNFEAIEKLVTRETIVDCDGMKLRLQVPSLKDTVKVRQVAVGTDDEQSNAELAVLALSLAAAAVNACLQDDRITEDIAARLVLSTGGERGELAQQAMSLCGLSLPFPDEEGDVNDDPT